MMLLQRQRKRGRLILGIGGRHHFGIRGRHASEFALTVPILGHVIILGSLAATAVSAIEGALVVGGLGGLGAALYSLGIPKDSVIEYEAAIKADGFLVMAHGSETEITRAKAILHAVNPAKLDLYPAKFDDAVAATA